MQAKRVIMLHMLKECGEPVYRADPYPGRAVSQIRGRKPRMTRIRADNESEVKWHIRVHQRHLRFYFFPKAMTIRPRLADRLRLK